MANLSSRFGASDEKIQALWNFEESDLFTDAERAAVRVAFKAGSLPNEVEAEDIEELKKYFDEGEIIEIVACETLATQVEDVAAEAAAKSIGPMGWEAGKHA